MAELTPLSAVKTEKTTHCRLPRCPRGRTDTEEGQGEMCERPIKIPKLGDDFQSMTKTLHLPFSLPRTQIFDFHLRS